MSKILDGLCFAMIVLFAGGVTAAHASFVVVPEPTTLGLLAAGAAAGAVAIRLRKRK